MPTALEKLRRATVGGSRKLGSERKIKSRIYNMLSDCRNSYMDRMTQYNKKRGSVHNKDSTALRKIFLAEVILELPQDVKELILEFREQVEHTSLDEVIKIIEEEAVEKILLE